MLTKITERAYFIFLFFLPFVYFSSTVDPVLIPRQLFLSLFLLLIALVLYSIKSQIRIPRQPIFIAIACYFLISLCSFFTTTFTCESHYILSKQLLVFAFLIATIVLLENEILKQNSLIVACIGFGFVAIGSAVIQIIEKTIQGQNLFRQIEIINGLFANKNLLSSVLFLTLPFFFMGMQLSKKIRITSGICLLFAFSIIIIIRTRVVLIATVLFLLILLFFYLSNRLAIRKRVLLIFVILISSIILGSIYLLGKNLDRFKSSNPIFRQYLFRLFDSKTLTSRTQFWQNSFAMFKDYPLFGVGSGNWQVFFPKYGLDKFNNFNIGNGIHTLQRPHNDFITLLCENGLLGFISYCTIFVFVYYYLIVSIGVAKSNSEKWKLIYIFAGISGYVLISFFDFPMERIEHQVLLMVLFAILLSSLHTERSRILKMDFKNSIWIYLIFLSGAYALLVSSFRFKGEIATVKMYAAKNNQQWDETLYFANNADNYFYKIDPTSIPITWYKGMAAFNQNEMMQSITYFEKAYQTAPYQIQVINNLGTAYLANGEKQKAVAMYLKALTISSHFEEARLNLAALYFNDKDFDKAFDNIEKVSIDSKNKKYRLYLVPILQKKLNQILLENGNRDLSKKIAASITSSEKIIKLYFDSKNSNLDFRIYILESKFVL